MWQCVCIYYFLEDSYKIDVDGTISSYVYDFFFNINNIVCTRIVFGKIVETLKAFIMFHYVKVVELRVQYIVIINMYYIHI